MTLAVPGTTPLSLSSRAPSIVVVGADALLGALPATPVQLAHACLRAGFQHVVPASWGDELVAGAALRLLQQRPKTPIVQCSCPLVAHRLLSVGTDLRPFLVSLVSPPVALARYLRAVYGAAQLHITYIGRCPGASDGSIDARMVPEDLFELFREQNIVVQDQPPVFDSVIPPDRRRYFSQPGGIPTVDQLWSSGGARTLVEISGDDLSIELAQVLLSDAPVLVDPGPALGCLCSGRTAEYDVARGRALLASLEPPRATTPVVDTRVSVVLEVPLQTPTAPVVSDVRDVRDASNAGVFPPPRATPFVRHSVLPPPSLPYHSDVEPLRDRATASPIPSASTAVIDDAPNEILDSGLGIEAPAEALVPDESAPAGVDSTEQVAAAPTDETLAVTSIDSEILSVPDETTPTEPAKVSASSDASEDLGKDAPSHDAAPVAVASVGDSVRPSPEGSRPPCLPQRATRFKAPKRRTPVHGLARITPGDVPMTRDSAGRSVPRAFASHRRQVFGLRLTELASMESDRLVNGTMSGDQDTGANGGASSAPEAAQMAQEIVVERAKAPADLAKPSSPSATIDLQPSATTSADPTPSARIGPAPMVGASGTAVETTPEPVRTPARIPEESRPLEQERPVSLPVEPLSDRPATATYQDTPAPRPNSSTSALPVRAPERNWTLLLVVVAVVALISAAAGVAIGAWYMAHHS